MSYGHHHHHHHNPCNQVGPAGTGPNQLSPIVTAPTQVYNNTFHPQAQPIVHPIEVINQHHIVPVPKHYYPVSYKDVCCGPVGLRGKNTRGSRRR